MASGNIVVEVRLSKEFISFVELYVDTLRVLTDLSDLVSGNSYINYTDEYKRIVVRVDEIVARSKRVDYGKS